MVNQCEHKIGWIPNVGELQSGDWNSELLTFATKVIDFNYRGQRDQINHPGFVHRYLFCPCCGESLDGLPLLTYQQALSKVEESSNAN